jgi:hypothetical protein
MKIPYLVSLSMMTRILLYPFLVIGNSGIKSIDITSNGLVGIGIGESNPIGAVCRGFDF